MELGHMDNGYGKKELVNIIGLVWKCRVKFFAL